MIPALALGCVAFTGMIAWLAWQCSRAPEGWQDREGFHRGRKADPFHHDREVGDEC